MVLGTDMQMTFDAAPNQYDFVPGRPQTSESPARAPDETSTDASNSGFTSYLIAGPFMVGQYLRGGAPGAMSGSVVLGSLANVSILGFMINIVTKRPSPMDPFGPFVAGTAQVAAGLIMVPLQKNDE